MKAPKNSSTKPRHDPLHVQLKADSNLEGAERIPEVIKLDVGHRRMLVATV